MTQTDLRQPQELLNRCVSGLRDIASQLGEHEDLEAQIKKAQHNLEVTQHNLKIYRLELAETEDGYKKLQREVEGKFAERDRLTAEIRELTTQRVRRRAAAASATVWRLSHE